MCSSQVFLVLGFVWPYYNARMPHVFKSVFCSVKLDFEVFLHLQTGMGGLRKACQLAARLADHQQPFGRPGCGGPSSGGAWPEYHVRIADWKQSRSHPEGDVGGLLWMTFSLVPPRKCKILCDQNCFHLV